MNTKAHILVALAFAFGAIACSSDEEASRCPNAEEGQTAGGVTFCYFENSIIEEGFRCPSELPFEMPTEAGVVCAMDEVNPDEFDGRWGEPDPPGSDAGPVGDTGTPPGPDATFDTSDSGDTGDEGTHDADVDGDAPDIEDLPDAEWEPPPCWFEGGCTCGGGEVVACGADTGSCTRGIRRCGEDDVLPDACVAATRGDTCETDADCALGSYCVDEVYQPNEALDDDCGPEDGSCGRRVCRTPFEGNGACGTASDCGGTDICFDGQCRPDVTSPVEELCNGLDDNCDGRIDDDGSRVSICGPCPFNMVLVDVQNAAGRRDFICVAQYEAARPDASAEDAGEYELYAASLPGVQPWTGVSPNDAMMACQATAYTDQFGSGFAQPIPRSRLCTTFEFEQSCGGTEGTASRTEYPYGDEFDPDACVSGADGPSVTGASDACSREIRDDSPQGSQYTHDMSGNVGEWVQGAGNLPFLAGGSYLDTDAGALTCGAVIAVDDVEIGDHVGFRCCTLRAQ